MSVIFDNWNTALIELKESLNIIGWLPHEIVYEIQNALVHLIIARRSCRDERRKELKRAVAHIRRAHLDALKICLFKIYEKLKNNINYPDGCSKFMQFQRNFSRTRLKELQSLGNWGVHGFYRRIIMQYKDANSTTAFPVPEGAHAATSINYSIIDGYFSLFWEWAQLETIQTSLLGQKIYDTSYNMVEAYLKWDNFEDFLGKSIKALKINIIILAIRNDCSGDFRNSLATTDAGESLLNILDNLRNCTSDNSEQYSFEQITDNIDNCFAIALEYMQISLIDISQLA